MSARGARGSGELRERVRDERGVTLVEVVIAAMLLMLGSLAVLATSDGATRASFRSEQSQVLSNRLQAEMEQIKALPYAQIALTGTPAASADASNPAYRVSGGQFALDRARTQWGTMVVEGQALTGGGAVSDSAVSPAPEHFNSADIGGTIQRFVVWRDDPACPDVKCPGTQDLKRVVVTIGLDATAAGGGQRSYQEIHGDVADPSTQSATPPGPDPPEGDTTPWWNVHLTDTPCTQSSRQTPGTHPAHNTLGACTNASSSCGILDLVCQTLNALLGTLFSHPPDLMFPDSAYPGTDPSTAPTPDYSSDVTPAGIGLRMPVPDGVNANLGCLGNAPAGLVGPIASLLGGQPDVLLGPVLGTSNPHVKVHKWVTPPLTSSLSLLNVGQGRLNLWTRTVNGASHPGKICVWLFRRQLNTEGIPVDTPFANLDLGGGIVYFPYSRTQWPTAWTRVQVPINFALDVGQLPTGSRLGVAVSVDKTGTAPGTGLQFMYDHPRYDSTLQLYLSALVPSL